MASANTANSIRVRVIQVLTPDKQYWWLYGKIGQDLFEASEYMRRLLRKGCKFTDGHKPRIKFSNLEAVRHLDTIIYETKSKKIYSICEVKATANQRKREFDANGVCGVVLQKAQSVGIPIFLAIVRLKALPPQSITTPAGYREYLEYMLKNPNEYHLEFYSHGEFELTQKRFVLCPAP